MGPAYEVIMDIYEAIATRRTVRDFEDGPVPFETLRRILDAGLKAPTNDHMRKWHFVVLDDPETRRALVRAVPSVSVAGARAIIDKWGLVDKVQRDMYLDGIPKQIKMILTAGALVIPCFHQPWPLLQPKSLSSLNGFASIWCCIENILLAAAAEGVFGVTRIPFDKESKTLREVLGIPDDYCVPCYLVLGYPKAGAKQIRQHVIDIDERISIDKWGSRPAGGSTG
jgi:nitroreductase